MPRHPAMRHPALRCNASDAPHRMLGLPAIGYGQGSPILSLTKSQKLHNNEHAKQLSVNVFMSVIGHINVLLLMIIYTYIEYDNVLLLLLLKL
jgi:hypothetical protein